MFTMTKDGENNGNRHEFDNVPLGLKQPCTIPHGTVLPGRKRYLMYFLHRHLEFRLPEVQSLAEIGYDMCVKHSPKDGLPPVVWEMPAGDVVASPFWVAHLPVEAAESMTLQISHRSMLVRVVVEVWADAATWDELEGKVDRYDGESREQYSHEGSSFKFMLDFFGGVFQMDEKVRIIEKFEACTRFKGKVDLKTPDSTFWFIQCDTSASLGLPLLPTYLYFGRQVHPKETGQVRLRLPGYELSKRRYIGPTSMNPELSYIMCAVAGLRHNSIFLDPFVGTGSVMIAAADLGAHTLGTDIDIRVIRFGKVDKNGEKVNIWTNFRDYNLPMPIGVLRADLHRSPFRNNLEEVIDTIVADPPYGVRAGARKSCCMPEMSIMDRATHIARTDPYTLAECLFDLVEQSAKWLVVGGRLAYWVPTAVGYYFEDELPTHPVFDMVYNCEQAIAVRYTRRLIVLQKTKKYDAEEARKHHEGRGPPKMALDELRAHVYSEAVDGVYKKRLRNKFV